MLAFLSKYKKKIVNRKGMTLPEVIIAVGILGIILGFVVINAVRIANQAYMRRANDTAEVLYMATQAAITDLKTQGSFDEMFADDKEGKNYNVAPDIAITGKTISGVTIPGVAKSEGTDLSEEEYRKQQIKEKNLVYMKLSKVPEADDSKALKKLLGPYLSDKSILDYSILIEVNRSNKTVRCAFYTERADKLTYFDPSEASLTEEILTKGKENVLLRERNPFLYDKRQGYYGFKGMGEDENLGILKNAYVKVNNDDMLTIDWGEIGKAGGEDPLGNITPEMQKEYTKITYDVSFVNAYDTSKVYYKIEDVTAYDTGESYAPADQTKVKEGTDVRSPMPIYDLYDYDDVNYALDEDLLVPFRTKELQADGTMKLYKPGDSDEMKHRLSYYVPKDKSGVKQAGVYRLVLDSITSEDDTKLSVKEKYPSIPWDENFKVIVKAKYKGEGFTGSLNISPSIDNAYVAEKKINPDEAMYFTGKRGADIFEEITNYITNRDDLTPKSNMWYEVGYSRHLNNMRYIVGDQEATKKGNEQNFLLSKDIDWSLQRLGQEEVEVSGKKETLHRLTVSNAEGEELTVTDPTKLRIFNPVSAHPIDAASKTKGFEGKLLSEIKRNDKNEIIYTLDSSDIPIEVNGEKVPVYNNFQLAYLKISSENTANTTKGEKIGLFDKVGQSGYLRDFTINGVTAYGDNYVGSVAGEFKGYAKNLTVLKNETPNNHKELIELGTGGKAEQVVKKGGAPVEIKPYEYPAVDAFTANKVEAKQDHSGGVFGLLERGTVPGTMPDKDVVGRIENIANGTRLVDLYAGTIDEGDQTQNVSGGNANPNVSNGIIVEAKNYAGGLVGEAKKESQIKKVVNTGHVEAKESYAGGIAGALENGSTVSGLDFKEKINKDQFIWRTYKYKNANADKTKEYKAAYTNYGFIKAKTHAGGVIGFVEGGTSATSVENVDNTGPIQATTGYAGGIIAEIKNKNVTTKNATNKADVTVTGGDFAGGIIGSAEKNTQILGVSNEKTQTGSPVIGIIKAGITSTSYAGGILGYGIGNDNDKVNIKQYKMGDASTDFDLGNRTKGQVIPVKNNVNIETTANYAGGIAGELKGTVDLNIPAAADGAAQVVTNIGNIKAGGSYAGGIIGNATDKVKVTEAENSDNTVQATENYAGGIVGSAKNTVEVTNAVNTRVSITASKSYAGGIVGGATDSVIIRTTESSFSIVNATDEYAGGIAGNAHTAVEILTATNKNGRVTADKNYAGGIVGSAEGTTKIVDVENELVPVSAGQSYAGGIAGNAHTNVEITTAKNKSSTVTAVSENYAGGIVGSSNGTTKINSVINESSAVTAGKNYAGGIVGSSNGTTKIRTVENKASAITAGRSYAGGIAGEAHTDVEITTAKNKSSEIKAETANYAGGIVGSANGTTRITNVENELGAVTAGQSYAGGLVGFAGADSSSVAKVSIKNDPALAKDGAGIIKGDYYSNTGAVKATSGNYAGGVAGYIETNQSIENVFNKGSVFAGSSYSGGIFGQVLGSTQLIYDTNLSKARMTHGTRQITNIGNVDAGLDNAGGIAGEVSSKNVVLRETFNRGTVKAGRDNAGGIAGAILEQGSATILDYDASGAQILKGIVIPAVNTEPIFYTNEGGVTAGGNNAGGIVGNARTNLYHVFNRGNVKAGLDNAGGIAGVLENAAGIEVKNDDQIARRIVDHTQGTQIYTNIGSVTARNTSGGIIGRGDEVVAENTFNTGAVLATADNAGGLAGYTTGDTSVIQLTSQIAKAAVDANVQTNKGGVTAQASNAGGIAGRIANKARITDVFNKGYVSATVNNAGGVVGLLENSVTVEHTNQIAINYVVEKHFMTNQAGVYAGGNNAGGIIGKSLGDVSAKPILKDVYSGISTKDGIRIQARNNAGGMVGRFNDTIITNEVSLQKAIDKKIYTNNSEVKAISSNAGGIIGNADGRSMADHRFQSANSGTMEPIKTGSGLDQNAFEIADVYNSGTVTTGVNAGGIFGVGGDGTYLNQPKWVNKMIAQDMRTNRGNITASLVNAGGVIGFASEKFEHTGTTKNYAGDTVTTDVADVFNAGAIKVSSGNNAGGIAGKAIKLDFKYSESVLKESMKAETADLNQFLFTNTNKVEAPLGNNAGGIIGDAHLSIIQDTFNSGTADSYDTAKGSDGTDRVIANNNAGGLVGRGNGLSISYSELISKQIKNNRSYVYTNIANVKASADNAGGAVGHATGNVQVIDVYNMGKVVAGSNNAGGLVGQMQESGNGVVSDSGASTIDLSGISISDNEVLKDPNPVGNPGKDIALGKGVSYITYRTITTSEASTTNRYTNRPKPKTISDNIKDNILAGRNNAGGIVGYVNSATTNRNLRIENVFNTGGVDGAGKALAGIRAKNINAGGLVGSSVNGDISYSFDINPGPGNKQTGDKGDHSTFAEAFNDIAVRKDPYAIKDTTGKYIGLHMIANNASVRASIVDEGSNQSLTQIQVAFATGKQSMDNRNAGGGVGHMQGGRIERVYSLQGSVDSPMNVGGVVGDANGALIKQVSRLDGEHISQGTKLAKGAGGVFTATLETRGSQNVGGIAGRTSSYSQVLDVRNYVEVVGRHAVGGVIGRAGDNTKVILAQNIKPITGEALSAEAMQQLANLVSKPAYNTLQLDRSKVDGSYIGGIVGLGDDTIQVTMAKNDPLITNEFKELQLDQAVTTKYTLGGNEQTAITGKSYVGGITGAYGILNYTINTGRISGVKVIGGISGSGYRITNGFNTANVIGENGNMYINPVPQNNQDIIAVAEATHIGGIAGELGERIAGNVIVQSIKSGTYIQSVFSSPQMVRGASFVGGIAGYAVGPIDVAYNSASVSAKQTETTEGNQGIAGTKTGGLVGVLAQDRNNEITVTNSYSVGEIVGTNDRGTLVGLLEGYTDETIETKRIKNSYYLSDEDMKSWNSSTSQIDTKINYGLKPLDVTDGAYLNTFVQPTPILTMDGDLFSSGTDKRPDTEYGLRNYSNMVRGFSTVSSSAAGSLFNPRGDENLKQPLNAGIGGAGKITDVQPSKGNVTAQKALTARFVYPLKESELEIGRDYEFPQLDFSGSAANDDGVKEVELGAYTNELIDNKQTFSSINDTRLSYYHNYWPTKVVDYMTTQVTYDDGGNDDSSDYTDGAFVSADANKTGMDITYRSGLDGSSNGDKYPTTRNSNEKLTIKGTYKKEAELPEYMNFEVYDGHSRARYNPTNTTFSNIVMPKSPVKTYIFAKASSFPAGEEPKPTSRKDVYEFGELYYLYAKDTNNATEANEIETISNIQYNVVDDGSEVSIELTLPTREMNSYLPASSGYFTAEATKVYDQAANITNEGVNTRDRTSRMFSMHFSNTEIGVEGVDDLDDHHNNSLLDVEPTLDFDNLDYLEYDSEGTAALGGILLEPDTGTDYKIQVSNKLQIRNERHLYNMNHGETMGYGGIGSSALKYLMRDVELKNNIQLSTNADGYNGFMIGASNERLYRMTGTLDGNGYTIGNIRVNRLLNKANFDSARDIPNDDYAFIYDLSGGVVKNLFIGDDSKIIANNVAGLAYYVSNGRVPKKANPYEDNENPFFENLSPQLPKEVGIDAKIYDTTVLAKISGNQVGGVALRTASRFNSSKDVPTGAIGTGDMRRSATFTDVTFGGKINARYGSNDSFMVHGDGIASGSQRAAGILGFVSGTRRTDDIDEKHSSINGKLRTNYQSEAVINGSEVTKDGYVFANAISAGILCEAEFPGKAVKQVGIIQKSSNNGEVISNQQANGITQGITSSNGEQAADVNVPQSDPCYTKSHVNVTYSYNNGIVQTPEEKGLASGIGNYVSEASYSTNNGSVYGLIASGISNYGDKHTKIDQSVNNGYVQGGQIAGGIVATPSKYTDKARPNQDVQLKLSNTYNTGEVVVTSNIDNKKAIENSYAGGILGYASSPEPSKYSWKDLKPGDIKEDDDRKTIITNSYNVGTVKYVKDYVNNEIVSSTGIYSHNNRNIGGIAGGGLNRFVDIQNSYSLSDAELIQKASATPLKIDITAIPTDFTKQNVGINAPLGETGYNYKLTAVGDVTYGQNVTTMNYEDMMVADNYAGFDDTIWTIDHDTKDADGNILYPFPQYKERETAPAYVGDELIADTADFAFNTSFNKTKNDVDIATPNTTMDDSNNTIKLVQDSKLTYDKSKSEYTIWLKDYVAGKAHQVTVFDGDAYAKEYAPGIMRQYQIAPDGTVTSGGKLHNAKSTTEEEMKFFEDTNVSFDTASGKLTIKDAEELGWYMPIHGYYTAITTQSSSAGKSNNWIAVLKSFFTGDGTVHGSLKAGLKSKTSERFQVHFGGSEGDGSNIHAIPVIDTGYKYGTKQDPYHVTDQYSVIGLTTSGIAQKATDERYYKQVNDVAIDQPFYSIFEFNGDYDGGGFKTAQDNGDVGFISYLYSKDEDAFVAKVHDLTLDIKAADTPEMNKLGKYQEASNYVANIGLITDYMDKAEISGVTMEGKVIPQGFHKLATERKYVNNNYTLAGVAAFARDAKITDTKNNAQIGVKATATTTTISLGNGETLTVPYDQHGDVPVEIAGITTLAKDTKYEKISNNGMLIASKGNRHAAGLVHTMEGAKSSIKSSMNGGWIRSDNGVAAGLVKELKAGTVKQVYNSGRISAAFIAQVGGNGTAIGGISDITGGTVSEIYNAGIIVAKDKKKGAIAGKKADKAKLSNAYYLKDDNLYWGDPQSLPDLPNSMIVDSTNVDELELYMGFAKIPTETWAFADSVRADYVITAADPVLGIPEVYEDPYVITYKELTDKDEMKTKGFDMTTGAGPGVWEIDPTPANGTINASNNLLRDYAKDPYPLPKFVDYDHKTRAYLDFPIFFGEASETAKTPYDKDDKKLKYEPYDVVTDARKTETFKDTIKVDLNDMKSTARYQVLVYDGDAQAADLKDKNNTKTIITVERKYVDLSNPGLLTNISNPVNMQYSKIYTNGTSAYYYEVLAQNGSGIERPAVFANKDFVGNKNEILFNNNVLDRLAEPSDPAKPYYSATVIEFQVPGKETTNTGNFYSKFSPHFANATEIQGNPWKYGTTTNPYEISTQRNLNNIALGGIPEAGEPLPVSSHYLKSNYKQTQDITMTDKKVVIPQPANVEGTHVALWQKGIGTPTIDFSGSYDGQSNKLIEKKTGVQTHSIFNAITKDASVSNINYMIPIASTRNNAILVSKSAGTVKNITVEPQGGNSTVDVRTTNNFGFVIDETVETPGISNVPLVDGITVKPGINIANAISNKPSVSTVIGQVEGFADIKNIVSEANIKDSGANTSTSMAIGGIIGKIITPSGASANSQIAISDVTYKGIINSSYAIKEQVGGIIGSTENIDLTLKNMQTTGRIELDRTSLDSSYGGLVGKVTGGEVKISDSQSTGSITSARTASGAFGGVIGEVVNAPKIELTNVESGTFDAAANQGTTYIRVTGSGDVAIGGIIGKATTTLKDPDPDTLTLDNVTNNSNIVLDSSSGISKVGGIIGYSKDYAVDMNNTISRGGMNMKTLGNGVTSYGGGIIAQVENAPSLKLTNVEAGIFDTTLNKTKVNIDATGSGTGNIVLGGIVGYASTVEKVPTPDAITMENVTSNHSILLNSPESTNKVGGILGYATRYGIDMKDILAQGSIEVKALGTNAVAYNGGIIGQIEKVPNVTLNNVISGVFDDATSKALTSIKAMGNGPGKFVTGGIIGHAVTDHKDPNPDTITMDGVMNNSDLLLVKPSDSVMGGILGYEEEYEVTMANTINRGSMSVKNLRDERTMIIGGFAGQMKRGSLELVDTSISEESNIVNYGSIEVETDVERPGASDFVPGTLYASSGVAFAEDSKIAMTGFKNAGNISAANTEEVTGNKDMNVYIGGALAYAKAEVGAEGFGVTFDAPSAEVSITGTLNEGNIKDNRKELTDAEQLGRTRTAGVSQAAGIVGGTSLAVGTDIKYSHNTGALKATTAAGIVHTVSGADNIAGSHIEYNINVGLIDVSETFENGNNITMTWELPVGMDAEGNVYNGHGEIIPEPVIEPEEPETPEEGGEVTPPEEGEAPAEGEEVPPSEEEGEEEPALEAPVMVTHFNLTLEDTIRPEKVADPEATPDYTAVLTLAEMQDQAVLMEKLGWDGTQIDQAEGTVNPESPWMMHSEDELVAVEGEEESEEMTYLLPVLRKNEATPKEDQNYTAKAVADVVMESLPEGGYKVSWTYEAPIDDAKDGFAIILDNEQGKTQKILELRPGVATKESDTTYSFEIKESMIANVTNNLENDSLYKVSVGAMRDENGRRMSSLPVDMTLEKTTGVAEDGDSVIMVIEPAVAPMMFNTGYNGAIGSAVVNYALSRLGDPYSMPLAGQGNYLDCSYLSLMAYRSVGINLPRTAAMQAEYMVDNGYTVSREELQPGDLIFYSWGSNSRFMNIGHVSIYAGDGKVIEASSTKGQVVVSKMYAENSQVLYGRPYAASPIANTTAIQTGGSGVAIQQGSAEETYLIAQIVGLEAGGEGRNGMIAVAEVIRNRVFSSKFPNTLTEVVAAPRQFTTYAMIHRYTPTEEQISIVTEVMAGRLSVLNNPNALYFCSGAYYRSTGINSRFWSSMPIIADYGNYFFQA